eukprot:1133405-Ditylum_brightwellii.AAC.1
MSSRSHINVYGCRVGGKRDTPMRDDCKHIKRRRVDIISDSNACCSGSGVSPLCVNVPMTMPYQGGNAVRAKRSNAMPPTVTTRKTIEQEFLQMHGAGLALSTHEAST